MLRFFRSAAFGVLAAIMFAALASPTPARSAGEAIPADADAPSAFVRNFFAAFDRRDIPFMTRQFEDSALVVHDDGVINTVPELMDVVARAKVWAPRKRELSNFRVELLGPALCLLTCTNRVVFDPDTAHPSEYTYTATWPAASRIPPESQQCYARRRS